MVTKTLHAYNNHFSPTKKALLRDAPFAMGLGFFLCKHTVEIYQRENPFFYSCLSYISSGKYPLHYTFAGCRTSSDRKTLKSGVSVLVKNSGVILYSIGRS